MIYKINKSTIGYDNSDYKHQSSKLILHLKHVLVSTRPNYADESLNMLITVLATKHYFTNTTCSKTRIENYFFLLQWS